MLSGRFAEMRWRAARAFEADAAAAAPAEVAATSARACARRALASGERRAVRQRLGLQRVEARRRRSAATTALSARRRRACLRATAPRASTRRHLDRRTYVVGPGDAAGEQRRSRTRSRPRAAGADARERACAPVTAAPCSARAGRAALAAPPSSFARDRDLVAVGERIGRIEHQPVARRRRRRCTSIDSPRLRPSVTGLRWTRFAASTTATRVPSPRNSSALVGTTSARLPASGSATCT